MTQYNFTVTERNGVQVFTSKRTGRVLTGAARKACEEALRRQEEEAKRTGHFQYNFSSQEEEEEYVRHLEEECDLITGMEMSAAEHWLEYGLTDEQRYIALYLTFARYPKFRKMWFGDFDPIERRAKEEAKRAEEEAKRKGHFQYNFSSQEEEEAYVQHLEDISDLITGQEKSILDTITQEDFVNLQINDKHQEGIAITGWAFNKPMFDRLIRASWDNALMMELTKNKKKMHTTTDFIATALRAMGWKYNRDRKGGFMRAAERFLWYRIHDFDVRKNVEEGKKILPGQFDPESVRKAMEAVTRCAKWAMERNEHEVLTNNKTRPVLAMICLRLLKAIQSK